MDSIDKLTIGARDAVILAREFASVFSADDLVALPHYHANVRMTIDGKPSRPFSVRILELGAFVGHALRAKHTIRIW